MRHIAYRLSMSLLVLASLLVSQGVYAKQPQPARKLHDESGGYRWILDIDAAFIRVDKNLFGNDRAVYGEHSDYWYESALTFGGSALWDFNLAGNIYADLAGLYTGSARYNAGVDNINNKYINRLDFYQAAIGWQSGDLFDIGRNALRISVGQQKFTLGTGFLIWNGGTNGGSHGDTWIAPNQTWRLTGLVDLAIGDDYQINVFYLSPNDSPDTRTQLGGINLEFTLDENATFGVTYIDIFDSNDKTRENTRTYAFRYNSKPLSENSLAISSEYAFQNRPNTRGDQNAWYIEPIWHFGGPANVRLSYRFASFDEGWDPLYYGGSDWGTWYQGEYLGEFILTNENLESHQARLVFNPVSDWTINVIYYYFLVHNLNRGQFANAQSRMTERSLAQEVDLIAEYHVTEQLSLTFEAVFSLPEEGGKQWSGGDELTTQGLASISYSF
ncbi:Uncharacterised protein [BD1-7 clade bacterium]|uniref:Alginate export domain-containing protein n=1 Tax=BD1-7 clade bacterium TaxID=2029982 RepID=A0A5S9QBR5_9GAMM|nr:Uncharacterised protein [BD1-7 clade bacterium]